MATAAGCGNDHVHSHSHDAEDPHDAESLAFDPTLASCCERDQKEFAKAMELKALLTAHDPTSVNVRVRQELFQPPPSVAIAPKAVQQAPKAVAIASQSDSDSDFDDSDDEFGVGAMLTLRRKQLELQMQQAVDGYGVVLDTEAQQLLQELQAEPEVPRVLLVVTAEMSEMRQEMAAVARRFVGTKFHVVRAGDEASRQLRLSSVPALAAFRGGERVDSIALDAKTLTTDASVLWEARFLPWLTQCNVLTTERQEQARRQVSKRAKEDEEEPSGFDCGVDGCRLRFGYEHEHVGTSQQVRDEIATWRT
ncbi:hypothetical protein PHYBOEH_000467 [Phytophthora boehmeriae]|uniref:Thioredoxin domain-containing protein n=1 Tax=Phytophthora boehmeriae TaxID=109152 RepID=A0A8T1WWP1_9STRA|nr:hypothetical protein PHYBOEH_000467 [Phytophthora boehmeriae]